MNMTEETKVIGTIPMAADIEDADIIAEEIKETPVAPELRPYIKVGRFNPNITGDIAREDAEGLTLVLSPDGRLVPEIVEIFILDMKAVTLDDKRTLVLTTRLRNNFVITESYTAPSKEEVNTDAMIELCKSRTLNKIWDYLNFLWYCASVSASKVKEDCGLDLYQFNTPDYTEDTIN
jgi:hypothetical protein